MRRLLASFFSAIGAASICLLVASVPSVAATPGVTVLDRGRCVVTGGVAGGARADAWDVTQEIFQTGFPTWLHAHTHQGAECITSVRGVTGWWFAGEGIHDVPMGRTLYTKQGRIHTAGNHGNVAQAYLGIHVLEAGTPFNTPTTAPNTPTPTVTGLVSIFKHTFATQPRGAGTFTIRNRFEAIANHSGYAMPASAALAYVGVAAGAIQMHIGATEVFLTAGSVTAIPRQTRARIEATMDGTRIAVTELVPGIAPELP